MTVDFEAPVAGSAGADSNEVGDLYRAASRAGIAGAMLRFGHDVSFEQARSQIGKGGDKLIPAFLSADEQRDHGKELEEWCGKRFKTDYLPLVRPFSAVPNLLRRVRDAGLRIAIASSAKKEEVDEYIDVTRVVDLVDLTTSSDDVDESKPALDIFNVVLKTLRSMAPTPSRSVIHRTMQSGW
ncbi:HAD hydrolase-like protein [Bradyrhizobium sp. UFLA01-814]|uniref:HAD hydrolase-like protein n=1 Tax=Bradyrhizobium sp. UFLA01-814 TaxID=3023480 RepID=UPI00398AC3FC